MKPGDRDWGPSLDRWITGNYGEDQFKHSADCPLCLSPMGYDVRQDLWRCSVCLYEDLGEE